MMPNPFHIETTSPSDIELVNACLDGSRQALEHLIKRHQDFIYNVALKMVLNPADAEDITQEVLIKIITKLSQFKGNSSFRTWLYRIVFNHILQLKKRKLETLITSFEEYGTALDNIANHDLSEVEQLEYEEFIQEAKIGCMAGMLLCLSREQRAVYILGEIFEADHTIGAEILEISTDNFRQRLSRARKDLYQFMNKKCGLVNTNNPCRCQKKTKGFIEAAWVDAKSLKFNAHYIQKINEVVGAKSENLDKKMEEYKAQFQSHPFQEKDHLKKIFDSIWKDKEVKSIFEIV
jgi:RNA polymerase sigma factor (sigma-70 family)